MELPHEIIELILLGLPVKDITRFKCVSKNWFALINDLSFRRRYQSLQQGSINNTSGYFYHRNNPQYIQDSCPSMPGIGPAKFIYTSKGCTEREQLKSLDYLHEFGYVLASSKGLLLLSRNPMSYHVYDLVSKRHIKLPRNLKKYPLVSVGFMCWDNGNQLPMSYIVVRVEFKYGPRATHNVETYSSEIGKWRKSTMKSNLRFQLGPQQVAKVIKGLLHWNEFGTNRVVVYNPKHPEGTVKFIELPWDMRVHKYGTGTYGETKDGSLQYIRVTDTIDLWVLNKQYEISYLDGGEVVIDRSDWKLIKKVCLSTLGVGRWDFGKEPLASYPGIVGIDPTNKRNIYLEIADKIISYDQDEDKIEALLFQKVEFDASFFVYFEWPIWPCLN